MKFARFLGQINPWVAALCGFILFLVSVSSQSIDMDEAQTWDYARLDSIGKVFAELRSDRNSESQMPLGMVAMWGWARIVGTSEMGLRSINLFWCALALAAMALLGRRVRLPWLPLLFAIQPFVWYSMDQARTPMMQVAGGALVLAGTVRLLEGSPRWFVTASLLALGAIILCGASMLGVVPLFVVLAFLVASAFWKRIRFSRGQKAFIFATVSVLGLLGFYYLSTLVRGAGGIKLWHLSLSNLLYVAYELLGFAGLGPGRQELREVMRGMAPMKELSLFVPGWVALVLAYAVVTVAAIKSWLTRLECEFLRPQPALWALCAAVPLFGAILLYFLASAVGFPFWGRHLSGVIPFAVTALAMLLHWAGQGLWRHAGRCGVLALIVLLALSAALIRFAPRHRHDDYRSAAAAAQEFAQKGLAVWWAADRSGGAYHGIVFVEEGPGIRHAANRRSLPATLPDAIVISRPENFDGFGTAEKLVSSGAFRKAGAFKAFEIFVRDQP